MTVGTTGHAEEAELTSASTEGPGHQPLREKVVHANLTQNFRPRDWRAACQSRFRFSLLRWLCSAK
jgi:hypothetical protein